MDTRKFLNYRVKITNHDFLPNIHQIIDTLKMNDLYLWGRTQGGKISYMWKFGFSLIWIVYLKKDTDFIRENSHGIS